MGRRAGCLLSGCPITGDVRTGRNDPIGPWGCLTDLHGYGWAVYLDEAEQRAARSSASRRQRTPRRHKCTGRRCSMDCRRADPSRAGSDGYSAGSRDLGAMTDGVTVLFGAVAAILAVLVPVIRAQGAGLRREILARRG